MLELIGEKNNGYIVTWALYHLKLRSTAHNANIEDEIQIICRSMNTKFAFFSNSAVKLLIMFLTNQAKPKYCAMDEDDWDNGLDDTDTYDKDGNVLHKIKQQNEKSNEDEKIVRYDKDGKVILKLDEYGWIEGWSEELASRVRATVGNMMHDPSSPPEARLWCAYALLQSGSFFFSFLFHI